MAALEVVAVVDALEPVGVPLAEVLSAEELLEAVAEVVAAEEVVAARLLLAFLEPQVTDRQPV